VPLNRILGRRAGLNVVAFSFVQEVNVHGTGEVGTEGTERDVDR
jgi:hypothetical protein